MRRGETPELGDRRRTVSTTSAMVLLVVAALVVGTLAAPLAAQEAPDEPPGAAAAADEPSGEPVAFPAPLVAATAAPDQPELAVRSLYVTPDIPVPDIGITVVFAAPFAPPADGYELMVSFGDPRGSHARAVLRTVNGAVVGVLEEVKGTEVSEVGPIRAELTPEGTAELVFTSAILPPAGSLWVSASVADPPAGYRSQLYPVAELLGLTPPGELSASPDAWRFLPDSPTPEVVEVANPPVVTLDGTTVRLTWPGAPPVQVAGLSIKTFVDVVRIAPDFDDRGQAPYLVAVDHSTGTINLLDGTQLIPATVAVSNAEWLRSEPSFPVVGGSFIEFDLDDVGKVFGIEISPEATAIGTARSITLADGTVVRADGVLGTVEWFDGAAAPTPAAEAPAATAPPPTAPPTTGPRVSNRVEGDVPGWFVPGVIVAAVAAVVLALLVVLVRYWRVRRARGTRPDPNLLDSGRLTLGRRLEPGEEGAPQPTVDLRQRPDGHRSQLDRLFEPTSQEVAAGRPIDVPDLTFFDEDDLRPVERAPLPRRPDRTGADDLTKAIFDAD